MTDVATIKGFNLSFYLQQMGIANPQQLGQALSFDSVTNVFMKEGTYTPNNDYDYLWQNIPASESPNFIFIKTPTVLNISVLSPTSQLVVNAVPVNKLFMLLLPPGQVVASVFIEGRLNQIMSTMAQGIPAQYLAVMAQANF